MVVLNLYYASKYVQFFFFLGYMYVRRCENINNNIGLWVV